MLFISRKDGTQQMCVYYCTLNEVTVESKYYYLGLMICLINAVVRVCSLRLIFESG
jgi:spore maturation protein SpmB